MQVNYKSSVFAELDRRCHSGSSRLRQIIFTNLRKAYLLHRTFRNIGDLLFQVKSLSRNQIYRAFSLMYLGHSEYAFSVPALSCGLAGISAFQRLPTSSCILGNQGSKMMRRNRHTTMNLMRPRTSGPMAARTGPILLGELVYSAETVPSTFQVFRHSSRHGSQRMSGYEL